MSTKRKKSKRSKLAQARYRGYLIEGRTLGRPEKDIFAFSKTGEKLYQASASDLSEAIRVIDAIGIRGN